MPTARKNSQYQYLLKRNIQLFVGKILLFFSLPDK